ncbi:MAG: coenzyme F420-0:L-glutamate ligase [Puniceicoccales bacterium]|jgi:F420-0:gamma-glutamyl ligase|nr:coenzyme F420-0:L-glutamate ligase [Puniceicoccales bacterium]
MVLEFSALKTRILLPPKEDIFSLFGADEFHLIDGDVLCVASKCLAIHQGRCIKIGSVEKKKLVADEADEMIGDDCDLTIKDGVLIAYSGIDESNGNGYYVLWPKNVGDLLQRIHKFLCEKFTLKNLGIISVDSRLEPMRRGTVGISQGIFGFNPVRDCVGNLDIFNRPLQVTAVNVADSIACAACYLMGEGAECCPLVIARGASEIEFGTSFSLENLMIPREIDFFSAILDRCN